MDQWKSAGQLLLLGLAGIGMTLEGAGAITGTAIQLQHLVAVVARRVHKFRIFGVYLGEVVPMF